MKLFVIIVNTMMILCISLLVMASPSSFISVRDEQFIWLSNIIPVMAKSSSFTTIQVSVRNCQHYPFIGMGIDIFAATDEAHGITDEHGDFVATIETMGQPLLVVVDDGRQWKVLAPQKEILIGFTVCNTALPLIGGK